MRLDRYLFENGYAKSRTKACAMIEAGLVFCNEKPITKASFDVPSDARIELKGEVLRYVSRGGLKLEGALNAFSLDVNGFIAVDIGASTGGFTDCLLQHGCARVYAIDAGTRQLDESLLAHPAVVSMENRNARYLSPEDIGEACDICVMDLSFISQTLVHRSAASLLKPGGHFISLIKPQFEVGRERIGKGGIVKDEKARRYAVDRVVESARACGFSLQGLTESPIRGTDGNCEYLAHFVLEALPE